MTSSQTSRDGDVGPSCTYRFIASSLSETLPQEKRCYDLAIRQQPEQAKLSTFNERDKRYVEPVPILQLQWLNCSSEETKKCLQSPFYFMVTHLVSSTNTTDALMPLQEYLSGTTVSSLYRLRDIDNTDGGFFVFGDLSVKRPGSYRLRFSLFEIVDNEVKNRKTVLSDEFTVYLPKHFPGPLDATFLSRTFSDQGVKIRIRKESRLQSTTRKRKKSVSTDEGSFSTPKSVRAELKQAPHRRLVSAGDRDLVFSMWQPQPPPAPKVERRPSTTAEMMASATPPPLPPPPAGALPPSPSSTTSTTNKPIPFAPAGQPGDDHPFASRMRISTAPPRANSFPLAPQHTLQHPHPHHPHHHHQQQQQQHYSRPHHSPPAASTSPRTPIHITTPPSPHWHHSYPAAQAPLAPPQVPPSSSSSPWAQSLLPPPTAAANEGPISPTIILPPLASNPSQQRVEERLPSLRSIVSHHHTHPNGHAGHADSLLDTSSDTKPRPQSVSWNGSI